MPVGVTVAATEIPPSTTTTFSTGNAFMLGFTDWGPSTPMATTSLSNGAAAFGTPSGSANPYSSRTTTCATIFDSVDAFYHEDGTASPTVYVQRVLGNTPVKATIALAPTAAVTFTAQYYGAGGNGIYVACTNNTSNVVITLTDAAGYVLATSPQLTSLSAIVSWAATTGLVTATTSGATLPSTATATAMTGGTDDRGTAVLTNWQTAINQLGAGLGPGQVLAPGYTNTTLNGIWSALGTHAAANNRVAICDMDDNTAAATLISALSTFGTSANASYCGFWAGNRNIPGVTASTTRSVPPSPVIAALCAQIDAAGNPNKAAAGAACPLVYATTPTSLVSGTIDTYSQADLNTLNASGINTFHNAFGSPQNYGFVSSVSPSTDSIYWQLNHARLRMAVSANAQVIGQPFVFSQIDGQGADAAAFNGALTSMLQTLYLQGALYGATSADAFIVDTGSDVNTPATIAAGQLNAAISLRMSPFAQLVTVTVNVVPVTQIV